MPSDAERVGGGLIGCENIHLVERRFLRHQQDPASDGHTRRDVKRGSACRGDGTPDAEGAAAFLSVLFEILENYEIVFAPFFLMHSFKPFLFNSL